MALKKFGSAFISSPKKFKNRFEDGTCIWDSTLNIFKNLAGKRIDDCFWKKVDI